jgi:hypothetical protein
MKLKEKDEKNLQNSACQAKKNKIFTLNGDLG